MSHTQTPLRATILSGFFTGFMAMFFDLKNLVDMMSIGTLMAYTIVAVCVVVLRYKDTPMSESTTPGRSDYVVSIGQEMMKLRFCGTYVHSQNLFSLEPPVKEIFQGQLKKFVVNS